MILDIQKTNALQQSFITHTHAHKRDGIQKKRFLSQAHSDSFEFICAI